MHVRHQITDHCQPFCPWDPLDEFVGAVPENWLGKAIVIEFFYLLPVWSKPNIFMLWACLVMHFWPIQSQRNLKAFNPLTYTVENGNRYKIQLYPTDNKWDYYIYYFSFMSVKIIQKYPQKKIPLRVYTHTAEKVNIIRVQALNSNRMPWASTFRRRVHSFLCHIQHTLL